MKETITQQHYQLQESRVEEIAQKISTADGYCDKRNQFKDDQSYQDLEFELKNIRMLYADFILLAKKIELKYEGDRAKRFVELRKDNPTDTSTNKALDEEFEHLIIVTEVSKAQSKILEIKIKALDDYAYFIQNHRKAEIGQANRTI